MKTICLVSCASKKRNGRHPARDLYISDLFSKSASYARRNADEWYILSAKFGLLRPDALIEKYDVMLNRLPSTARRCWAKRVFQELDKVLQPSDRVIVLAGQRYTEFLVPMLCTYGVDVSRPLARLRIGEQLKWLKNQMQ